MTTKNRMQNTIAGVTKIAAAVTVLSAGGGLLLLYILVRRASQPTLMWWAAIATLLCPTLFVVGLLMGAYGARREIAGIKAGFTEVVHAANKTLDLRGQAASQLVRVGRQPGQTQQNQTPGQSQLDLSPLDEGPDFEVEEFAIGGGAGGHEQMGSRRTIQA